MSESEFGGYKSSVRIATKVYQTDGLTFRQSCERFIVESEIDWRENDALKLCIAVALAAIWKELGRADVHTFDQFVSDVDIDRVDLETLFHPAEREEFLEHCQALVKSNTQG